MAISDSDYGVFMKNFEITLSARNQEEFLEMYPEAEYPPPPDPSYAELLPDTTDQFQEMLRTEFVSGRAVAAVLTTGSTGAAQGRATITYDTMTTPVVLAQVLDATWDTTYFTVVVESVSATSATVRVAQNTAVTVLGISVLALPSLAVGATVHVFVYDAG